MKYYNQRNNNDRGRNQRKNDSNKHIINHDYLNDNTLNIEEKILRFLNLKHVLKTTKESGIVLNYIKGKFMDSLQATNYDKESTIKMFSNGGLDLQNNSLPSWKLQKLANTLYQNYESNNDIQLEKMKTVLSKNQNIKKRLDSTDGSKLDKICRYLIANSEKNSNNINQWLDSFGLSDSVNEIKDILFPKESSTKTKRNQDENDEEIVILKDTSQKKQIPNFLKYNHLKQLKGDDIDNKDDGKIDYQPNLPTFSKDTHGLFTRNSSRKSGLLEDKQPKKQNTEDAVDYENLDTDLLKNMEYLKNTKIQNKSKMEKKSEISDIRQKLPIYQYKQQIIDLISSNQISIIIGETGSGKTTQLCQYIHEVYKNYKIIITQPRRVAAISVSKRVNEEIGIKDKIVSGYKVRFEEQRGSETRILFMTDGILIREFLNDPLLKKYNLVIIDEAHERSLNCDIILGILKKITKIRPDLKVCVMSATLNAEMFSDFFGKCPILRIPGKTFPVELTYLSSPTYDYLTLSIDKAVDIHFNEDLDGDILIFLTGAEEIEKCVEMINEKIKNLGEFLDEDDLKKYISVLPIYSSLSQAVQDKIFIESTFRKIIVSTNIAETSLTIPNIKYVVDCGYTKINVYNPFLKIDQLKVVPVSKQQADQRMGRAGRVKPGKCYRLFTKNTYEHELLDSSVPEIQRVNLCTVVLQLKMILTIFKKMNVNVEQSVIKFPFIEPPSLIQFRNALEQLFYLNAIEDDGEEGSLTNEGRKMVQFPLDPYLSKTLLEASTLNCLKEVLIIISFLNLGNSIFEILKTDKERFEFNKMFVKNFKENEYESDLLNYLKVYKEMERNKECTDLRKKKPFGKWCEEYFINTKNMLKVIDILNQLIQISESIDLEMNSSELKKENVIKAFIKAFKVNIVVKRENNIFENLMNTDKKSKRANNRNMESSIEDELFIHPTSSLFKKSIKNGAYLMYISLIMTKKNYMNVLTVLKPDWILEEKEFKQDTQAYKKIKLERVNIPRE
ncbi:unnamed protein product [Hanseniaspora opuntiae]